jgi:hypothetical protein
MSFGLFMLWVCIHTGHAEKFAWPRCESNWRFSPWSSNLFSLPDVDAHSHRGQANFSAWLVWMHTQSNITNIIFTWVHNTNTHKNSNISCSPATISLDVIYEQRERMFHRDIQTRLLMLILCLCMLYNIKLFFPATLINHNLSNTKSGCEEHYTV